MSIRTDSLQAQPAFVDEIAAWCRCATATAVLALGFVVGTSVVSFARISLSAPAKLPFVEVENVAHLLARLEGDGPVMVYFSADWCATCAKIERRVFPDPRVVQALAAYLLVKVDITRLDTRRGALMKELRVAGPPTMVFFGNGKREVDGTRLVGPIDARALVASALKAGAE